MGLFNSSRISIASLIVKSNILMVILQESGVGVVLRQGRNGGKYNLKGLNTEVARNLNSRLALFFLYSI